MAGFFYPGARDSLLREVDDYLKAVGDPVEAKMVVLPHAGYIYSGPTAGETAAMVNVPKRVILLGPKHRRMGARGAVSSADGWDFPFGNVPVDRELADLIVDHTDLESDDLAHREEHSLEVQVPFLWRRNPDLALTPVAPGIHTLDELKAVGEGLPVVVHHSRVAGTAHQRLGRLLADVHPGHPAEQLVRGAIPGRVAHHAGRLVHRAAGGQGAGQEQQRQQQETHPLSGISRLNSRNAPRTSP